MPVRRVRRSRRFFLVAGLALLLAVSLAACGGTSDDAPSSEPTEAAPQAAIAVEPPEPEPPLPPVDTTSASIDVDAQVTEAIESSLSEADAPAPAVASSDILAEADTSAPIEEADMPPLIVPLTAASDGPVVPVVGPLIVVSEDVSVWRDAEGQAIETRRGLSR